MEKHALVIEDNSLTAWLIEEELRDLGYTSVDIAATEQEALTAARRRRPDLITSDENLEEGNGTSAVRTICAQTHIPVIFISGDVEHACRHSSDTLVLDKPFSAIQLGNAVKRAERQGY